MALKVHHPRPAPGAHRPRPAKGAAKGQRERRPVAEPRAPRPGYRSASFEGGQMPLHMRIPKLKGFKNPTRSTSRSSMSQPSTSSSPRGET